MTNCKGVNEILNAFKGKQRKKGELGTYIARVQERGSKHRFWVINSVKNALCFWKFCYFL